jgi:hypothetical protein
MTVQWAAVAIIVPLCTLYAIWNLMGAAGRGRVSVWLSRLPWPTALQRRLVKIGANSTACGCDGCDKVEGAAAEPPAQSIVRVHHRKP